MTFAEFLARVRSNSKGATRNRISTADRYVKTLTQCAGNLCPADRARYTGPEFDKVIKQAANTPVYSNDFTRVISKSTPTKDASNTLSQNTLAIIGGVYTSKRQDRDNDILEPKGAEIDPNMPLLWQHDPTAPIGKHLAVTAQDDTKAMGESAIVDIPLGRDAALLAEVGALRFSHGFRPKEFEPITEKSGGVEQFVGFHVRTYEMMEISLVSVPSNTDAVLTQFHRNKLCSSMAKAMAVGMDQKRRRVFTTGFGFQAVRPVKAAAELPRKAPTGKKRKPVKRNKAAEDFEKALATACASIIHSADYGLCFYQAATKAADSTTQDPAADPTAATGYAVWWTSSDSDDPSNVDDNGQSFSSSDEIKAILSAVPGVTDVTVEAETNPPYDEGWREVYPEVKDWTSGQTDPNANGSGGSSGNSDTGSGTPAALDPTQNSDPGKGKPVPRQKDDQPVSGSFEHVADILGQAAQDYLLSQGIQLQEGEHADVEATYPDYVIIGVATGDEDAETDERFFKINYSIGADGTPAFSGPPQPVELELTVSSDTPDTPAPAPASGAPATNPDGTPASPPAPSDAGKNGKLKRGKWVPKKSGKKGKIGKKDTGLLKEAQDHLQDAMSREGMNSVCKTLVRRGADLVGEVLKSDGSDDQQAPQAADPVEPTDMSAIQRSLWNQITKAVRSGGKRLVAAALMKELADSLFADDVAEELNRVAGSK